MTSTVQSTIKDFKEMLEYSSYQGHKRPSFPELINSLGLIFDRFSEANLLEYLYILRHRERDDVDHAFVYLYEHRFGLPAIYTHLKDIKEGYSSDQVASIINQMPSQDSTFLYRVVATVGPRCQFEVLFQYVMETRFDDRLKQYLRWTNLDNDTQIAWDLDQIKHKTAKFDLSTN